MQFSQKIDGFRQKEFTGLLEVIQLYKQNPLEKFLIFTIYQNYTLALREQLETYKECREKYEEITSRTKEEKLDLEKLAILLTSPSQQSP